MPRKKTKYALGCDPSINQTAWAIVSSRGDVRCGLVRNPYRSRGATEHWVKLDIQLAEIVKEFQPHIKTFPKLEAWVCEGQYCTRRGNQEHMVRLGWISATVYALAPRSVPNKYIAVPNQWTRGIPKEIRHHNLLQEVAPESEWTWVGPKAPPSLMYEIYDAVGMAVWGLSQAEAGE